MASMYTIVIPTPAGVPDTVELHIMASRRDGKALTREELEAVAALYPPPSAEGRAMLDRALAQAPTKPATKAPAGTKAKKPVAKRAAAKRPASR